MINKNKFFQKFSAENLNDFLHKNVFWLPFWLLFGIIVGVYNKYDFEWDFLNYHLYNPWKLLDSDGYDIYMPLASINSFFNPLIDMPLYLMIKYLNNWPNVIYALQSLWFGGLLFIFHKTVLLFFTQKTYRNVFYCALTILIGITGQATWKQAGASTNEVQLAFLIMAGVYWILKLQACPNLQKTSSFFWAGILMGVALGLKQTSMPYSFAIGLTLIIFHKKLFRPYRFIGAYILGGFLGCIGIYGYFMYDNFINYGNPIMPFMNTLFKSEYFDLHNFHDRRYMPDLSEFLYYPYLWEKRAAEIPFVDKRGPIFYTLSWLFAFYALGYSLFKKKKAPFFTSYLNTFTAVYLLISYLIWSLFFSIFRYIIPMEMFFAIFIVKTADVFLFRYFNRYLLLPQTIAIVVLGYTLLRVPFSSYNWNITDYHRGEQYIKMEEIKLPPNTLVKLYNLPTGILAPLLAQNNPHFKAVIYVDEAYGLHTDFTERNKYGEIRQKVVAEHTGPVVSFGVGWITNVVWAKNKIIHDPAYSQMPDLDEIDRQEEEVRAQRYKKELKKMRRRKGRHPIDEESLVKLVASTYSGPQKRHYIPSNDELKKMYCRRLEVNFDMPFFVCVPTELKDVILDPKVEKIQEKRKKEQMLKRQKETDKEREEFFNRNRK